MIFGAFCKDNITTATNALNVATTAFTGFGRVTPPTPGTDGPTAFIVGAIVPYFIEDGDNREEGLGTIQAGSTFDRTTVKTTLVSGVYDDTTPARITLSGSAVLGVAVGASDMMNKSDTSFENALWRSTATLFGTASNTHVNLGNGASETGKSGQNYVDCTVGGGSGNKATFSYATIPGGINCLASGEASFSTGFQTQATGNESAGVGYSCQAIGDYTFVACKGGDATHARSVALCGAPATRAVDDLVIGGTDTTVASVANNTIRLEGSAGNVKIDGAVTSPEAGIGEMVEWRDGNPDNEDRTGLGVSIVGGKLVVGGTNIVGVISQTCSVISNNSPNNWSGMYLRDKLKRKIFDTYTLVEWVNEWAEPKKVYRDANGVLFDEYPQPTALLGRPATHKPVGKLTETEVKVRRVNPDFDVTKAEDYKPRSERKEWGIVEVKGQPLVLSLEPVLSEYVDFDPETGKAVEGTTHQVMNAYLDVIQIWYKGA